LSERKQVDLKKLADNINTVRENLSIVRSTIRGALGLGLNRPLLLDVLTTARGQIEEPAPSSEEKEVKPAPQEEFVKPVFIKELQEASAPQGLGLMNAVRRLLEESVKQVELKTRLMEAEVEYYKEQLRKLSKTAKEDGQRKRTMQW